MKTLAKAKSIQSGVANMAETKQSLTTSVSRWNSGAALDNKQYKKVGGNQVYLAEAWKQMKNGTRTKHWLNYDLSYNFDKWDKYVEESIIAIDEFNNSADIFLEKYTAVALKHYSLLEDDSRLNLAKVSREGLDYLIDTPKSLTVAQWESLLAWPIPRQVVGFEDDALKQFTSFFNRLSIENQQSLKRFFEKSARKLPDAFLAYLRAFEITPVEYDNLAAVCTWGTHQEYLCKVTPGQGAQFSDFVNSLPKRNRLSVMYSELFKRSSSQSSLDAMWDNSAIKKDDMDIDDFIHVLKLEFGEVKSSLIQHKDRMDKLLKAITEHYENPQMIAKYKLLIRRLYEKSVVGELLRKLFERSSVFQSIIAKAQAKASYDDNQRLDEPLVYHLVDEEDELSTQSHLSGQVIDIKEFPDRKIIVVQQGRRKVGQRVSADHDMTVTVGQIINKGEVIARSSEQYSLSDTFELKPPTFNELKTMAENFVQKGYVRDAIGAYCAALAMRNDQGEFLETILELSVTHLCTRDYHPRVEQLVLGFYNDFLSNFSAAVDPIAILEYCINLEERRALLHTETRGFRFHEPIISKLTDCSRYAITDHERLYNAWSEIIAIHQKHNPGATGFFIHMLKQQGQLTRKKPTLMKKYCVKTLSVYEDSAVSSEHKLSLFIYSLILFSDNPQLKGGGGWIT